MVGQGGGQGGEWGLGGIGIRNARAKDTANDGEGEWTSGKEGGKATWPLRIFG